jgi:hypothetical protein
MEQDGASRSWHPESEEDYEVASAELKQRFAVWAAAEGTPMGPHALEGLLHYKWTYLDGHLTRWTRGDLENIYLEIYPAKVIVEVEELDEVLAESQAFLRFLADTRLLDEASEGVELLCDYVSLIEESFRTNMADVNRYSPGKRLWSTAEAEGLALDDRASVEAFMARFNAKPRAERDAVLGTGPRARPQRRSLGRTTPPGTRPSNTSAKRRNRRR